MVDSEPAEDRDKKEQEEWYERTRYQILLFAIGVALFIIVGALVLDWYINPHTSTQKKDLAQALGLITAGVAGAVGIFFTWRGQRLARETQENNQRNTQEQLTLTRETQAQNQQSTEAQLDNAQEELRLTRQGQMTERFTQAIEQLGNDKVEIRLGGIYSLERTAQEAKNYHWPVMEVLTSYVRRHAARKPEKESAEDDARPEPEIQAILDVIGRRSEDHRTDKKVEYGTIDLNNTDLRGANLQQADLQQADLQQADLQQADLHEASLSGANLSGANLREAIAPGADLQQANLKEADLRGAMLRRANLSKATFFRANLAGATLNKANLLGADFEGGAFLHEADLSGANLHGALLPQAHLVKADLSEADLQEAYFYQADLHGANLHGANLSGARQLAQDQIDWAIGSNKTELPQGLKRPRRWSKPLVEQATIIQVRNDRGK